MFEVASAQVFEFGEFRLDTSRRLLLKNGEVVPLTHKAFETLALLVEHRGRIVEMNVPNGHALGFNQLARNLKIARNQLPPARIKPDGSRLWL